MMDILTFDSNAKLLPSISDKEKAIYHERYEAFYEDFINTESAATVPYSQVIKWSNNLEILKAGLVVCLIKIEVENLGAKLNGIRLSIEDRKAIVSMEIPITLSIPVIIEALTNVASKII
jgi:hypothetical protein